MAMSRNTFRVITTVLDADEWMTAKEIGKVLDMTGRQVGNSLHFACGDPVVSKHIVCDDDGSYRFNGTDEDREAVRLKITFDRYGIDEDVLAHARALIKDNPTPIAEVCSRLGCRRDAAYVVMRLVGARSLSRDRTSFYYLRPRSGAPPA